MPAPPTALVDALRAGTAKRHILFKMTHSQGTLLAWDGLGKFSFGGDTYLGVGGLATVEGVSDSGDVQNHEVLVTLNGVGLPALLNVDPDIRGEAATITALWLAEAGTVIAWRVLFIGVGDVLTVQGAGKSLTAKLRAPMADWSSSPRATWTDADQQRRYAGDNGFKMVKLLENTSVSGWSKDAESSGSVPRLRGQGGCTDSITGDVIGDALWGLTPIGQAPNDVKTFGATYGLPYKEETSGAPITFANADLALQAGGINCYVDIFNVVRTPGGLKVLADGVAANYLRRQTAISANGTSTATRVTYSGSLPIKESGALGDNDRSGLVYSNKDGSQTGVSGASITMLGVVCVEETTGAAVAYVGSWLQCGGADCKVSTTGVILTPGGRRVVRPGGSAAEFLRVWT